MRLAHGQTRRASLGVPEISQKFRDLLQKERSGVRRLLSRSVGGKHGPRNALWSDNSTVLGYWNYSDVPEAEAVLVVRSDLGARRNDRQIGGAERCRYTWAAPLIQRFGRSGVPAALNANLHFHMLYLNGVYDIKGYFWPVKSPSREELDVITHTIALRVACYLEKAGYLVRDPEHEYLDLLPDEDDAMTAIVGASITYRLAFGPNVGLGAPTKALTLKTVPATETPSEPNELVSHQSGFSLHAGVACKSSRAA